LSKLKTVCKTLTDDHCYVLKSDKGNTLVVIDEIQYNQKMFDMIDKLGATKMTNDPTKTYIANMKRIIKPFINVVSNDLKKDIINENAYPPFIKGLPKVHKTDAPLRPIVNFRSAPAYKLAGFLLEEFTKLINIPDSTSIKNSLEFINQVKSLEIEDHYQIISLDITAMYSNINVSDCIEALTFYLHRVDGMSEFSKVTYKLDADDIKEYLELTKLVLEQNYFQFADAIYYQKLGLPMGSPLSGFLANLVMSRLETKIFERFRSNIKFWKRYMDDTFIIFNPTRTTKLTTFIDHINIMHPTLKFTHEIEDNGALNFLDITVTRFNKKLSFKVFRKPTNNDRYIDGFSSHPLKQKYAAISNLTYRAVFLPMSTDDRLNELEYIRGICRKNNLNPGFVSKYSKRFEMKKNIHNYTSLSPINKDNIWTKLHYYPGLTEKIQSIYNTFNLTPAISNKCNIARYLPKVYKSGSTQYSQGIYQLNCSNCNSVYVGQTGVSFKKRFTQHLAAIRNNRPNASNFASHILDTDHNCNINYENNFKILEIEKDWSRRCFLEGCYIRQVDIDNNVNCVNAVKYPIQSNLLNYAIGLKKKLDRPIDNV